MFTSYTAESAVGHRLLVDLPDVEPAIDSVLKTPPLLGSSYSGFLLHPGFLTTLYTAGTRAVQYLNRMRIMVFYNRLRKSYGRENMELRHLRYFIRAAELMHFTKAAESLYVSQPALSAQIHQLEEELGVELFARVGRNVRLTEAGESFLKHALQAVHSIEAGEQEIDAIKGLLRGKLHICAVSAFGSTILPPVIAAFQKAHPQVYVKLSSTTSDVIQRGLLDGTIDIGLLALPLEHDDLQIFEVFSDEIVVVVAENHEFAKRKKLKPADLDKQPLVLATQHIMLERGIGFLESHGAHPKIMAESEETTGVLNLIKSTGCAAMIPKTLVGSELIVIPFEGPALKLAVAWTHLTAAANEFLKVVKANAPLSPCPN